MERQFLRIFIWPILNFLVSFLLSLAITTILTFPISGHNSFYWTVVEIIFYVFLRSVLPVTLIVTLFSDISLLYSRTWLSGLGIATVIVGILSYYTQNWNLMIIPIWLISFLSWLSIYYFLNRRKQL